MSLEDYVGKKITEIPGLENWDKYNGVTVGGKSYSYTEAMADPGLSAAMSGTAKTIYPAAGGGFTSNPGKAAVSLSWDQGTGKVSVSAPKEVYESDWFKKQFSENDNFNAILAAYKNDPTGTSSVTMYDKDGNEETKTIQEVLQDYQKSLEEYAKYYGELLDIKKEVEEKSGGGISLSDDDAVIYAHSTTRDKHGNDNNAVVFIPDIALGYVDFDDKKKFASWNPETHTISAKDFYTWYNLDDGTENKDQIIDKITDAAAIMYNQYNATQRNLPEGERDDKAAANDYARTVSFLRTLNNDNPTANVFTSTRLFVSSAANSLVDNLFQATGNVLLATSDLIDGLDAADEEITPLKLVSEPLKFGRGLYRTGELMFYTLGSTLSGIDISAANKQLEEFATLGDIADSISDGDASGLIDVLSQNMGLSRELTAQDMYYTGHKWLLDAHDDMTRLSSAATAGSIVGGIAGEAIKQITLTNPVGKAAEASVSSVARGMTFLEKGFSAKQLAGAIKYGSFSANIAAQGLSDTILNDEVSLRKMFLEGDPSDAVEALGMNVVFNFGGELTGLATSKGWDAFTKTSVGQAVEAFEQRQLAKVSYRKNRALANLAEKFSGKNAPEGAEFYQKFYRAEANASEKIAHAGKYAEAGESITEATKRLTQQKVDMEIAFTRVATQTGRTVLQIQTNPALSKQFLDTKAKAGAVVKAEGALGLSEKGAVLFTQDTSDYIYRVKRVQELSHKEVLTQAEENFKTALEQKIAEYKGAHTPEFLNTVDDYIKSLEVYEHAFRDFLADNDLIDREELDKKRASGLWGKDGIEYVHLQTLSGKDHLDAAKKLADKMSNYKTSKAKIEMEEYHYKVGDVDAHALDPQLTILSEQLAAAKVLDSRRWGEALIKTQPYAQEIDTKGKPVTSKELNSLRSEVNSAAEEVFKMFSKDEQIFAFNFAEAIKKQYNLEAKAIKKQLQINKLLKLTDDNLKKIALGLDEVDVMALRVDLDFPEYLEVTSETKLKQLYASMNDSQKALVDDAMGGGELKLDVYNEAIRNSDLALQLERAYIANDSKIINSKAYKEYATYLRERQLTAKQQLRLEGYRTKLNEIRKEAKLVEMGKDEFTLLMSKFEDQIIEAVMVKLESNHVFNEAISRLTTAGADQKTATRYLVVDRIKKELASNRKQFERTIHENLGRLSVSGNLSTATKNRYFDIIKETFTEDMNSEWRNLTNILSENGAGKIINTEELFNEVRKYMKDIIDTKFESKNVIRILDKNGEYKLYEVSPTTAYLYNSRPDFSNIKTNGLVKFFNKTNRIFKLMTTGWGLSSFENQWIRDPLNAYVMGGMRKGLGTNTEALGNLLGPNITDSMLAQLDEAGWGKIADVVEGEEVTGKDIAKKVRSEAEMFYGNTSEETLYYRRMDNVRKDTLYGDYTKPVGKMEQALEWMEEHSLGNFRETYLRKSVYVNAYNNAIERGKTLKEAANWAEYVADNATTDFSRAFAWGNQLTASVPYFGAAINGSKSFWRLLELDPVGVSGRFFSGIVIPTIALTAKSLQDEEDKKVYMNIPEYMKEDNICFVVNGSMFKIPIPQELSTFVAPFRQLVEKAHDANDEAWQELVMSDIFGLSPIDLDGLVDLDDPLGKDADFWSRLSNEAETLISQISPVAVKTAYMAATGRDPYTHSEINREYTWIDADGNPQIMDSEDNALAKFVSSACKSFGIDLSASSAEALLSGFFGQASVDFFGSLGNIFSGDLVGAASVYGKQISKPFYKETYDQADSAWKGVVKELQAEKQALMANDSELSKLTQKLMYATDAEERKTLRANIRRITQAYQDRVFSVAQRFNNIYGSDYDYRKFASTINLLNFTNPASYGITDAALDDAQELYNDNRNQALLTMSEMGFNSANDLSIFGYIKTDADGKAQWKATLPTAIAYSSSSLFYQGVDETLAKLNRVLTKDTVMNGTTIKKAYNKMWDQANAYAKAGKWNERDRLFKDWDISVMVQIYPVLAENDLMDQYGNSLLDNKAIIDLLDDYIRVPNDGMGRGKYLSASSGIDKNRGYARSYIQKIYKQLRGE